MSWDEYVKNLQGKSRGHCDRVMIIGLDGGAPWISESCSGALRLSGREGPTIAQTMKSKRFDSFRTNGIFVEGRKYVFLREDGGAVFGRCKDEGITLQASKSAVIIGHTGAGKIPGNTNTAVNTIVEYLKSVKM